jgi:putative redox protein
MKINVKKISGDFHMEASNEDGNLLEMDGSKDIGGEGKGMRPMQLLLAAVGGCSSIDVLLMLKKQKQQVDSFDVEVEGHTEKMEDHRLFRDIVLHFKITGHVEMEKAARAVQLSMEKYCSVSKTLEPTAKITYKVTVNHFTIKELHIDEEKTEAGKGDSTESSTGKTEEHNDGK